MYLNVRRPPFDNLQVRRALNLATDRGEFVKVMTGGEGNWAIAGAFPDTYAQDEIKKMQPYDRDQARRLLAQAGYPNGLNLEFLASSTYGSV